MFHRVKEVFPLSDYNLFVTFVTGERKKYDVSPLFEKYDEFKTLSQVKGLFEQVKVDAGGYGISWNDETDLSCDELWERGKETGGNTSSVNGGVYVESGGTFTNTGGEISGNTPDQVYNMP